MARSSQGGKRHPVEAEDRSALARPTGALRPVANLLRPVRALEARRHLGSVAFPRAVQVGCGGRGGVGGERGFLRSSRSSARRRSTQEQEPSRRKKGVVHPPDEALGRGRGGFSSKLHLTCDGHGRPLSVVVTPGQRHESTQLETLLDSIRVKRAGRGRPRKRPDRLIADKGYDFSTCRELLRRRAIPHTIPERRRRRGAKRPGRPLSFEKSTYARRNVVERCVNRLKQWRSVATRYEKRALNYRAVVVIASLMIWLAS